MDSSTTSSRRDRLVMGLGITALLLFAANLITMVKHHFFDAEESALTEVYEIRADRSAERQVHRHIIARPSSGNSFAFEFQGRDWTSEEGFGRDMARLKLDLQHLSEELSAGELDKESMLRSVEKALEKARIDVELARVVEHGAQEAMEIAIEVENAHRGEASLEWHIQSDAAAAEAAAQESSEGGRRRHRVVIRH